MPLSPAACSFTASLSRVSPSAIARPSRALLAVVFWTRPPTAPPPSSVACIHFSSSLIGSMFLRTATRSAVFRAANERLMPARLGCGCGAVSGFGAVQCCGLSGLSRARPTTCKSAFASPARKPPPARHAEPFMPPSLNIGPRAPQLSFTKPAPSSPPSSQIQPSSVSFSNSRKSGNSVIPHAVQASKAPCVPENLLPRFDQVTRSFGLRWQRALAGCGDLAVWAPGNRTCVSGSARHARSSARHTRFALPFKASRCLQTRRTTARRSWSCPSSDPSTSRPSRFHTSSEPSNLSPGYFCSNRAASAPLHRSASWSSGESSVTPCPTSPAAGWLGSIAARGRAQRTAAESGSGVQRVQEVGGRARALRLPAARAAGPAPASLCPGRRRRGAAARACGSAGQAGANAETACRGAVGVYI